MVKMKKYYSILVFIIFLNHIISKDFYTFESNENLEISKRKIEEILSKIDSNNFKPVDETLGFQYRWRARWFSPFNYDIYLTTLEKNKNINIIRIEGNGGDALSFRTIFFHEKLSREELKDLTFYPIYDKYHLLGQTFNLIHPSLGILYAGYHSPSLTRSQMWYRGLWYFVIDSFLIWAGGRNWFKNKWDPAKYSNNILATIFLIRTISGIQNFHLIRAHNRYHTLGYTFPLDLY